jgi:hypothetical protein
VRGDRPVTACLGVGGHHPTYELQDVIVLDDSHPITKGVTDFKVQGRKVIHAPPCIFP